MKLFKVPSGTKGYLLVDGPAMPELKPWTTRKELIFQREDLAGDPITQANTGDFGPKTIGHDLIRKGYSLFNPPFDSDKGWNGKGRHRKPKYVLAVPFASVETM